MSCPKIPYEYTEGDTLPDLVCVLESTDLTDYTIQMRLQRPDDVLVKDAVGVDLPNGQFKFVWADTDLVAGNDQTFAIVFETLSGDVETSPDVAMDVKDKIE